MTVTIHQPDRSNIIDKWPVFLPSLIWLLALLATLLAVALRGGDILALLPFALAAAIPGLLGLILSRFTNREWAQILLMLSWAGLAVMACVTMGFMPSALIFIAVPAIASLFQREKVLEAIIIASLIGAITWFAGRLGYLPAPPFMDSALGRVAFRLNR